MLPSRLLDVGTLEGRDSQTRLIRTEERDPENPKYLTLSHCWGQTQHTMALSHENLDSMMTGVSDEKMPRTFRDAIMITRFIGLRYLWIDSMCIIQPTKEDNSDWDKEGRKMGDIYRNSTCTIAASSARDNTEGCFQGKPGSQFDVFAYPLFGKPVHRDWDEYSKMMGRNSEWMPLIEPPTASWLNHVQNSPLSSRAWVLQERMLSPRILHCTMQGFFWECSERRASEYEPLECRVDSHFRDQGLLNINKLLKEPSEELLGWQWRQIIEKYTKLQLSVKSDLLPALSGLASVIQRHTGDDYIAGHWKSSLISSLLWFRLEQDENDKNSSQPTIFSAPSWSWASKLGVVKFTPMETKDFPGRDPKDIVLTAVLRSVSAEAISNNTFSWLSASHLKVRGRLLDGTKLEGLGEMRTEKLKSSEYWTGFRPLLAGKGSQHVIKIPRLDDDGSREDCVPIDSKALCIIYDVSPPKEIVKDGLFLLQLLRAARNDLAAAEYRHEGLVLTRSRISGCFERIGYFRSRHWELFDGVDEVDVDLV